MTTPLATAFRPPENDDTKLRREALEDLGVQVTWQSQTGRPDFESAGFENKVDDCFFNALLQALFHNPSFAQWLRDHHDNPDSCFIKHRASSDIEVGEVDCVACELYDVLSYYWGSNDTDPDALEQRSDRLRNFRTQVINDPYWQGGTGQEDVGLALNYLDGILCRQAAHTTFPESHAIRRILQITWEVRNTCTSCYTTTVLHRDPDENEHYFLLPMAPRHLQSKIDLRSLLFDWAAPRLVDYNCEKTGCGGLKRYQNSVIYSAPEFLCICLARISNNEKLKNHVEIEETLDLTRFYGGGPSLKYELYATAIHIGNTQSGHYINHAKDASGQWAYINDEIVNDTDSSIADRLGNYKHRENSLQPYCLFYRRLHGVEEAQMQALPWEEQPLATRWKSLSKP